MRRRTFIAGIAIGFASVALSARILWLSTEAQPDPFVEGFREGLRNHGYVDGQNVEIDLQYAPGNPGALQAAVGSLIRTKPDLVVSSGPAIRASRLLKDVPVLFAISGDPVELGIAQSLSRPGGNFTGSTFMSRDIAGKRVELFKELGPEFADLLSFQIRITPASDPNGGRPRRFRRRSALRRFTSRLQARATSTGA
jgi:putative ABC transport system substrate-binding protein